MPRGADSEVSTNSVRRAPITSGGLCPAPASVILRRAGSQYAKRAVAGSRGGLGQAQQQLEVGQDGDGVLALHHGVRPQ